LKGEAEVNVQRLRVAAQCASGRDGELADDFERRHVGADRVVLDRGGENRPGAVPSRGLVG